MSMTADPYMSVDLGENDVDTAAWSCINKPVMLTPAPPRHDNIPVFGQDLTVPRPMFNDEQTVDLQFVMTGTVDPSGTPYSSPPAGLAANKRLFLAAYYRQTRDPDGCLTATVVDIDGETYTGRVQIGAPQFGEGLHECNVVMPVTIVDYGELEPGGS